MAQHNEHMIDRRIHILKAELAQGGYPSADAYYQAKDTLRQLCARKAGMSEMRYDPMGFWFGRQSN